MSKIRPNFVENFHKELHGMGIDVDINDLSKIAAEELERQERAMRLLSDPFLFQREVVCPENWRKYLSGLHYQGLQFVQGGRRMKLILWPRGHLKSTIFTQGELTRRATIDPDIRILIGSSKHDNSKRFLQGIKGILNTERYITLFGNQIPPRTEKGFKDNEQELTFFQRKNFVAKEPTFSTTGLDATQTSQHYDLIDLDDIVVRENSGNEEQLEKVYGQFGEYLNLLEPRGELWLIGTRRHPLDVYGRTVEDYVDERCRENDFEHVDKCKCYFDVSIRELEEDGQFIFPAKFNAEYAKMLLDMLGMHEFCLQYRNNPIDPGACWFKMADVKAAEIPPEEINAIRDQLQWYIATDPAESLQKRACYTATIAVGLDMKTGMIYVDYAKQERVETPGLINTVFDTHKKYRPVKTGIEANTHRANLFALKDAMVQRSYFFHIEEMKPDKFGAGIESKEVRVKRIGPLLEFGRIRINNTLKDLLDILYTLPASKSMDLPDALSYAISLLPPGAGSTNNFKPPKRRTHWARTGL